MPDLIDVSDGRVVAMDVDYADTDVMIHELTIHPELIPKDGLFAVYDAGAGGFRLILKHGSAVVLPEPARSC